MYRLSQLFSHKSSGIKAFNSSKQCLLSQLSIMKYKQPSFEMMKVSKRFYATRLPYSKYPLRSKQSLQSSQPQPLQSLQSSQLPQPQQIQNQLDKKQTNNKISKDFIDVGSYACFIAILCLFHG